MIDNDIKKHNQELLSRKDGGDRTQQVVQGVIDKGGEHVQNLYQKEKFDIIIAMEDGNGTKIAIQIMEALPAIRKICISMLAPSKVVAEEL